ncbi:sigma-70 family RNA polymerase sigma factor [Streptomyces sp. NBC_01462]|uniref:sigma-70 family RNA polymerase sigma factor n=1 Tax=Streptomyces sp. NBC_01462 TaxID=2903876 RepID=UPI002E3062A7|nr:sigma-70 family RNA polymerase sigma factor [Streptomyces sp. NBC_01462]
MPSKSAAHSEDLREAEAAFHEARGHMYGIACRILGSGSEADDVLQEAWIRWQTYDRSAVKKPHAFLATTVTRLAINVLQSARARRETSVDPWLLEQVDTMSDPALGPVKREALEAAVLMLMERLTPAQRAAYVLRVAFDYPYGQIAEILGQSPAGARQLVSRARKHLAAEKRATATTADCHRYLTAFVEASHTGHVAVLEKFLTQEVVSHSDSGGAAKAA